MKESLVMIQFGLWVTVSYIYISRIVTFFLTIAKLNWDVQHGQNTFRAAQSLNCQYTRMWLWVCLSVFWQHHVLCCVSPGGTSRLPDPCNPGQDQTVWMDDWCITDSATCGTPPPALWYSCLVTGAKHIQGFHSSQQSQRSTWVRKTHFQPLLPYFPSFLPTAISVHHLLLMISPVDVQRIDKYTVYPTGRFDSVTTDVFSFSHRDLFWQRWCGAWRALEVGVLKSLMREGWAKQREGGLLSLCWQLILHSHIYCTLLLCCTL